MRNGWTGGQYSLYRAILGIYLGVHFAALLPWGAELFSRAGVLPDAGASPLVRLFPNILAVWDAPGSVTALLLAGVLASIALTLGAWDRLAAIVLWYLLAALVGRNPLILNPSLPFIGWLLLAHALLPPAPYGSWRARGRIDPGGGWRMPEPIFAAAWIVMSLGYSYSGWTKLISPSWVDGTAVARVLANPLARDGFARELALMLPAGALALLTWGALALELLFAPIALMRRARPWLWLAMLLMHLGLMALIDFAELSLGMVVLHLFTFDPAWIRGRAAERTDLVFYDGTCGLCHGFVRFLLAEDPAGARFRFAPLGGEEFKEALGDGDSSALPDSVVVRTASGEVLIRSTAVIHVLERLGGIWRAIGILARVFPARLLDAAYDAIARIRHRIFTRPKQACPVLPPSLRNRFGA